MMMMIMIIIISNICKAHNVRNHNCIVGAVVDTVRRFSCDLRKFVLSKMFLFRKNTGCEYDLLCAAT